MYISQFRAGFMHHKLQCHIHDLHLQISVVYHCSLFFNFIIHHFFLLTAIEWHDTSEISTLTDIGLTNPLTL